MDIIDPCCIGDAEARRFLENPLSGSLDIFDCITCAGAEVLNKHKGKLSLNGIRSISDSVAEKLGRHIGKIEMNSVSSITKLQAKCLSSVFGGISLNGLTHVTPEVALHLSEVRGELNLDGLLSINFETFKILMEHRDSLSLCGLQSLPEELYESVHEFSGTQLLLAGLRNGIPSLNPRENQIFIFNGIHSFDEDDLHQISFFSEGEFVFNGVKHLDPCSVGLLGNAGCLIHLMGLEDVPRELLLDFIACPRIIFDRRWRIEGDIEEACAKHGELFFWDGGCMLAIEGGAILVRKNDDSPEYSEVLITCRKYIEGRLPFPGDKLKRQQRTYCVEEITQDSESRKEITLNVS